MSNSTCPKCRRHWGEHGTGKDFALQCPLAARPSCAVCGDGPGVYHEGCPLVHNERSSRPFRLKPEHANSPLLAACAAQGLTEEQTIAELAKQLDQLQRDLMRMSELTVSPRMVVTSGCTCPLGTFRTDAPIPDAACPVHGDNRPGQGNAR